MKLTIARPPNEMSDAAYWFKDALRLSRKLRALRSSMRKWAHILDVNGALATDRAWVVARLREEIARLDGRTRRPASKRGRKAR